MFLNERVCRDIDIRTKKAQKQDCDVKTKIEMG